MRGQILKISATAVFAAALLAVGGVAGGALAQEELGKNGAWAAYTFKEGGKLTCYMYSQPTKKEGK